MRLIPRTYSDSSLSEKSLIEGYSLCDGDPPGSEEDEPPVTASPPCLVGSDRTKTFEARVDLLLRSKAERERSPKRHCGPGRGRSSAVSPDASGWRLGPPRDASAVTPDAKTISFFDAERRRRMPGLDLSPESPQSRLDDLLKHAAAEDQSQSRVTPSNSSHTLCAGDDRGKAFEAAEALLSF